MKTVAAFPRLLKVRSRHTRRISLPDPQPEELDPACAIQAKGLRKTYGSVVAVEGLDLSVRKGEVVGLLGPNGSGKTTTILMLMGLTEPSDGWARVLGYNPLRDPLSVKRRVGYMPDSVGFYDHLTATENLEYTAMLAGLDAASRKARIREVLTHLELSHVADKKVGTFSKGMRQRLGLAEVLVKEPGIIILDEPTSGLDPEAAREFLAIIRALKERGITILLSSHLLHQVQEVCDRVLLFYRGEKVLEGTVADITRRVMGSTRMFMLEVAGTDPSRALASIPGILRLSKQGEGKWTVEADRDIRADIADSVTRGGGRLLALSDAEPTLDDVYARYFEQVRTKDAERAAMSSTEKQKSVRAGLSSAEGQETKGAAPREEGSP
jgi:ABC-2 type transport system ATP-binding protein